MKKKKINYVDNKKFFAEIVKYKEELQEARKTFSEEPRIPDYVGECIFKIANKLSTKPCFMNYSYRDEMISDGIENCILYFNDYNPEISQNPFAYFTQIIYYAFLRRIGKEEKNRYIIYKNFQETMTEIYASADEEDSMLISSSMYDNINVFMSKFERKEEIKKEKRKKMKTGLLKFYEDDDEKHTTSSTVTN